MNRKYNAAVILVNYNSSAHTISCVKSIYDNTSPGTSFQIIIIDNNSNPDDYENLLILSIHSNIKIIRSKINTGFATGCMMGVQEANADYYFFLNNDCILMNDSITILKKFMDSKPKALICSPQLHNTDRIPTTCFNYRPDLLSKILGTFIFKISRSSSYVSRKIFPSNPIQVEVLSGSQLFVRAIDFENIGGFDTTLFLYCEEEDLAFRTYKANMELWLVPEAKNSHVGGASTRRTITIDQEFLISFFYFYEKHYGKFKTTILRLIYSLRYLKKSIKDVEKLSLVWLILSGAHMKHSLRHKQKISNTI